MTSSGSYGGVKASEDGGASDVRVVRISNLPINSRAVHWVWFWLCCMIRIPFQGFDRCVVLTDPPFLPLVAFFLRSLGGLGRRFYWWTMDLYPEALAGAEMLKAGSRAYRVLHWLNTISIRQLSGVVALGNCQVKRMQKYPTWNTQEDFCVVVPPWDFREISRISRRQNPVIQRFGWEQRKVVLYAGNLGQGHLYEELLEAARRLHEQGDEEWLFAFFCHGNRREALEQAAADLPNLTVRDYLPPEDTSALLNAASVHAITMRPGWEGVIVPSKLYGVLQTPAPVLFVGPENADTAAEIRRYHKGECLPVGCSAEDICAALTKLAKGRREVEIDRTGPATIAEFVMRN